MEVEGRKHIIKARLCLKGFAEANQHSLHTYSPTATRLGHKLVCVQCAINGWELWSLDVSTAFLKGWTFDEMNKHGFNRQPCAFVVPKGLWEILSSLEPDTYAEATKHPHEYCFELCKAAYGLKDAPLLWNLRAVLVLVDELGFKRSCHDSCLFIKIHEGALVLLMSLHVDDTLVTGPVPWMTWLHTELETRFGALKKECNDFKHFGVDMFRDPVDKHVTLDQTKYIANLKPLELEKIKTRKIDDELVVSEITAFRSLVSGIAWTGITSPGAQAIASLYQGFLPKPLVRHAHMLNIALQQLVLTYVALVFCHGFDFANCKMLVMSDSSLGNTAGRSSQGGYVIFLTNVVTGQLCDWLLLLAFRSANPSE